MKDQTKTRENDEAQQYKFRPRAFTIDRVFEDKSNDTSLEWQEFLLEEEFTEKVMLLLLLLKLIVIICVSCCCHSHTCLNIHLIYSGGR